MSLLRFKMVEAAINHKAVEVKAPEGSPSEYFGTKVFGREAINPLIFSLHNHWSNPNTWP